MRRKWGIVVLVFACVTGSIYAQKKDGKPERPASCQEIDDKDAVKAFEEGIDRKKNKKEARVAFLEKALDLVPDYVDANYALALEKIATAKLNSTAFKPADQYFLKVIETCPKYHSDPYYFLGFSFYEQEKYADAMKYLKKFLDFVDDDDKKFSKDYDFYSVQAKDMMKYGKTYDDLAKMRSNPVPFDPKLVNGICTRDDEYLATISPDNELAMFTRRKPKVSKDQVFQSATLMEVFSFSERKNGNFDVGNAMPDPFNRNNNEGGASISLDNRHIYFTICKDEGGSQLNCDIYYSDFVDGKWTESRKVPGLNDPVFWDSQPCIAADGRTLFFASDRKGGIGEIDIYKSVKDPVTKMWSTPENLGPKINTKGKEKSPFMHSDSETLYFSSDGHPGLGGFDIFYIRKNEKGEWDDPKNIGFPINTEADDLGFFASTDGHHGYFASNNPNKTKGRTAGGYDVYSFELYQEARPQDVAFIKGKLVDEIGEGLKGASIEITNMKTKEKTTAVVDSFTGQYAAVVSLKKKDDIMLTVKRDGYAFNSKVISVKEVNNTEGLKPMNLDFNERPVLPGEAYTLNNIQYATNSAELLPESRVVIDGFIEFLKEYPNITFEIRGHTDNVGNAASNLALSTDRAFTVRAALEQGGIPKSRIIACRGYGADKPIEKNDTEDGRAKNRRTEFFIVDK